MKIKANNANNPIWKDVYSRSIKLIPAVFSQKRYKDNIIYLINSALLIISFVRIL